MENKYTLLAWLCALCMITSAIFSVLAYMRQNSALEGYVGANSQYGMPGIYHASPVTLSDGDGTALKLDSNGRLILSPHSTSSLKTN